LRAISENHREYWALRRFALTRSAFCGEPQNPQFERRLIGERTRDGMNAARAKGSRPGRPPLNPEKLEAALLLVKGGMSPTKAARRTALGRSTLYREIQARDHT